MCVRIHFASAFSDMRPAARFTKTVTTSASGASISCPFSPRNTARADLDAYAQDPIYPD